MCPPLRPTQWHDEMINLHNTSLAILQNRIIDYASPPDVEVYPGVSSLSNIRTPSGNSASLCSQVKIQTTAYVSFSVLGPLAIFIVSAVIVVTNQALPSVVAWRRRDGEKTKEWVETGVMQLHRILCEGRGLGPWNGKEDGIPRITEMGRKFSFRDQGIKEACSSSSFT